MEAVRDSVVTQTGVSGVRVELDGNYSWMVRAAEVRIYLAHRFKKVFTRVKDT